MVKKAAAKKSNAKKPMTKSQLIAHLSEQCTLTKKQIGDVLAELAAVGYKEAKKGFTLPGFGKLVVVKRKARMGRNPATGESIKIPAKTVLKFRIAKACKDAVLGQ
ncbi:MAG: HU family DNA-binding protein [Candidatus Omnitrophica bacterium]|nr:HU family DNA-binding protein [Candidatus Omnitrophota bacterium]